MDKRSVKILLDTYWSSSGWIPGDPKLSAEDFDHAKAHRLMFDPVTLSHGEVITRLRVAADRLDERKVVDAFVASLSTRRLDWRSALGSYSVARWLPAHEPPDDGQCRICGLYAGRHLHDLNVLNFMRLKWGGVRHSDPMYALLDLELFLESPPPAPVNNDALILRQLIAAIAAVPASMTSAALQKHLPATLASNKSEREQLIAILGLCGVLNTAEHPSFAMRFISLHERTLPDRHFVDMAYPACWWTGRMGIDQQRLQELFGHLL